MRTQNPYKTRTKEGRLDTLEKLAVLYGGEIGEDKGGRSRRGVWTWIDGDAARSILHPLSLSAHGLQPGVRSR